MINNVVLVGRITKDPELKYTPSNQAVAKFILAVNRTFKNANGEREADFVNCVAWRKTAELIAEYAKKGSLIGITGRIQTRNYENQEGQRVYVTEIVAESMSLLESRNQQQNQSQGNQQLQQRPQAAQQRTAQPDPFSGGSPMNLNDDDLPF